MTADKFKLSGSSEQSVRVAFEGTTYVLRVRRDGVYSRPPGVGGLIAGPAKAATWVRWTVGSRDWTVETLEVQKLGLRMQVGGRSIAQEVLATKAEAIDRANELLLEWGVGDG